MMVVVVFGGAGGMGRATAKVFGEYYRVKVTTGVSRGCVGDMDASDVTRAHSSG